MSHETHHHPQDNKPTTSYNSAFWFVIILVGLFIAAVNFVNVMGHDEEEGHGGHESTEMHGSHEAAASQSHEGENGTVTPSDEHAAEHTEGHTGADTTHTEGH